MNKLKNIEFLRIVGCFSIVFFHVFHNKYLQRITLGSPFFDEAYNISTSAEMAVDLFFIISGVFFVLTLNLKSTIWEFLLKKIVRFYPVMFFSLFVSFLCSLFELNDFYLLDNILTICGLSGTGLANYVGNIGVFWYVSSFLWTAILLFYLIKNYEKKHVNLFVAFLIFFCYSFIIHAKNGRIEHHTQTFYYVFNIGMMRAFGGIGIGYFIAELYRNNIEKIKLYVPSSFMRLCFTSLEFICLFFIISNFFFKSVIFSNDIIYIVNFLLIVVLFLVNKGYIAQFFNKKIWVDFSKYTYSIYMTHVLILSIFPKTIYKTNAEFIISYPIYFSLLTLFLILCLGIITYHFIEAPSEKYLKTKFNLVR